MLRFLCLSFIVVVLLCGCTTHQQRNTFKSLKHPAASEIKTYTYKQALKASQDSDGFYNFFLLPGIDPHQAYAFEEKFAEEEGFGYNVYTGAHPHSVESLVYINVPVELLEAYIQTIAAHIQADSPASKNTTFRAAITHYMTLRKAIYLHADPTKESTLYFQAEADNVLLGMFLMLVDSHTATKHRVNNAWRTLDRVKFHMYKKTYK